jgi:hypothetical protein
VDIIVILRIGIDDEDAGSVSAICRAHWSRVDDGGRWRRLVMRCVVTRRWSGNSSLHHLKGGHLGADATSDQRAGGWLQSLGRRWRRGLSEAHELVGVKIGVGAELRKDVGQIAVGLVIVPVAYASLLVLIGAVPELRWWRVGSALVVNSVNGLGLHKSVGAVGGWWSPAWVWRPVGNAEMGGRRPDGLVALRQLRQVLSKRHGSGGGDFREAHSGRRNAGRSNWGWSLRLLPSLGV